MSSTPTPKRRRRRRHAAEVTADRLGDAVTRWADAFTGEERDMIGLIIFRLDSIAANNGSSEETRS